MRKMLSMTLVIAISFLSVFSLASCEEKRTAALLMHEFCSARGMDPVIYTPSANEGEPGYVRSGFFDELYGEGESLVSDFAVVLLSDLARISECGVFICYTDYDALLMTDVLQRRIELVRSVAAVSGLRLSDGAFVYREGRAVVMCALSEPEDARKLWRTIL